MRELFAATNVPSFTVEVTTDKGIKGYGNGGPGGGAVVTGHLAKLMMGRDPFDVERNWDICWRSTMSYGRMGVTMNAISGFDMLCRNPHAAYRPYFLSKSRTIVPSSMNCCRSSGLVKYVVAPQAKRRFRSAGLPDDVIMMTGVL